VTETTSKEEMDNSVRLVRFGAVRLFGLVRFGWFGLARLDCLVWRGSVVWFGVVRLFGLARLGCLV